MEAIEENIHKFYQEWEYYCYPDKTDKCRNQVDNFLKEIDKLQEEISDGKKKEKAKLFYLKGKILDLLPAYQKTAEQFLHKSIKLNPTNGDCWNTLAHVLFKKGDIESSQQAINMALEHKGKNKVSLRYQSVLLRCKAKNEQERRKNVQESLNIIKGAIMLDMKDPITWYFLGNAYFSNFITNFKRFNQLENAIKAYNEAQKYFKCQYPDLFTNRGNVESHMQDYQAALRDFNTANQIENNPVCLQSIQRIKQRMQYTKTSFQRARELKKSKIQDLIANIPNSINNNKQSLQVANIQQLKERENQKKLLTAKLFTRITKVNQIPHSYLAIDNQGTFFTLSLYNINAEKVDQKMQKDALISVLNPQLKYVIYESFKYPTIQVFEPIKLRVNDTRLTKQQFNPAEQGTKLFRNDLFKVYTDDIDLKIDKYLQEMYSSWLEEMRFNLQSIEVLQKAIVSEMLAIQDNPKEKAIAQHRINNFLSMIQQRSKSALNFIKQQAQLKKEELLIIEGQRSLKTSEKKKPAEVIWQNFYDKAKQLRDQYKKQQSNNVVPKNTVEYYREIVFKPPFKELDFSLEENKGRYVDMHVIYLQFLNLCKIMQDSKETTRLHDYLWFLQNMDKFDDFSINKKFKNQSKYTTYLNNLYNYLADFMKKTRSLMNYQEFQSSFENIFEQKYSEGKLVGWDQQDYIDQSKTQYCASCKKIFMTNQAFVGHLMGKKHIKLSQNQPANDPQEEQKVKKEFREQHQKKKKNLAFMEFRTSRLRQELASVIYDTMNLVRKKQTRGYQEVQEVEQEESSEEQVDAPIYNPKNLPLGWDGKPIPYWLYKLHGLGIEYKCQICGNYSYWGRRAFQMHFQEWRHTYGMKCLKIPNTIHFRDITTINDALALHQKLVRQSQEGQFMADIQEQFQDNQGNLLNRKTYLDMKKQGLIN